MFQSLLSRIIGLIGGTPDQPPPHPPAVISEDERYIIQLFADGVEDHREQAISIYRRHRRLIGLHIPEMRFMSEVDTDHPDLGLRARYREEVVALLMKKAA